MMSPFRAYENLFSFARTKHVHLGTHLYNHPDMQQSNPHDVIVLFARMQLFLLARITNVHLGTNNVYSTKPEISFEKCPYTHSFIQLTC
jgi:hypothetical protein